MACSHSSPMAPRRRGSTILRSAAILISLVVLPIPVSAQATPGSTKIEGSVMTNHEAWRLYEKYLSAWNTTSIEERLRIANDVLSETIEYQTARHDLTTG